MNIYVAPTLTPHQLALALDLLDIRDLAPREALRRLDSLTARGEFSQLQANAIREALAMDDAQAARHLRQCCDQEDDDCLDLLRSHTLHEAHGVYLH